MKAVSMFLCVLGLPILSVAQYNSDNLKVREAVSFTYKNLRLYPVFANQVFLDEHKDITKYTSLQKAVAENKIAVTETGGGSTANLRNTSISENINQNSNAGSGSVNTLFIENTSNDTIMIMAGEVVKGGKQDRVLAQDMVLLPHSGRKDISVFCVEHGRWQYSSESQKANNTFYGYSKVSTMSVRKAAIVEKDQQKVWDNVADVTSKNSASSRSGSYTALDTSKKYNEELKAYIDFFNAKIKSEGNVIGMVACTGDKVIGCDMFATPDLFKQYFDNLMSSYSTEAISNGSDATASYQTVQTYLDKILTNESKQESEVEKNGTILKSNGKKLHMATFD
jgi:hypothetical protein